MCTAAASLCCCCCCFLPAAQYARARIWPWFHPAPSCCQAPFMAGHIHSNCVPGHRAIISVAVREATVVLLCGGESEALSICAHCLNNYTQQQVDGRRNNSERAVPRRCACPIFFVCPTVSEQSSSRPQKAQLPLSSNCRNNCGCRRTVSNNPQQVRARRDDQLRYLGFPSPHHIYMEHMPLRSTGGDE